VKGEKQQLTVQKQLDERLTVQKPLRALHFTVNSLLFFSLSYILIPVVLHSL
jgi:hypothetical protein